MMNHVGIRSQGPVLLGYGPALLGYGPALHAARPASVPAKVVLLGRRYGVF